MVPAPLASTSWSGVTSRSAPAVETTCALAPLGAVKETSAESVLFGLSATVAVTLTGAFEHPVMTTKTNPPINEALMGTEH